MAEKTQNKLTDQAVCPEMERELFVMVFICFLSFWHWIVAQPPFLCSSNQTQPQMHLSLEPWNASAPNFKLRRFKQDLKWV